MNIELDKNIDSQFMDKINKEIKNSKMKNLDIYIMEKDKEIMNLCSLNKSLINQIENLKKAIKEKELEIASLKTDLNSLDIDKNLNLKEIERLNMQINNLNTSLLSKENQINEISKKNDENISKINNVYDLQIKNYESNLKNAQNIQINNNSLTEKLLLKDKEIINMQKIIYDLKQENKKFFNLEKENEEKNKNILDLKTYIKKLERENFIKGNNNDLLLNYTDNNYLKDNSEYNFDYSNYNKNINKINNNKSNDKAFNDYYNYLNNNLISFIIEQIKKVELAIDDKSSWNFNNNNFSNNLLNEENSTYELIKQNFDLLINKIKFLHEENFKNREICFKKLNNEKNKILELSSNIKLIQKNSQKEINSMKRVIEMKTGEINQLNDKLNKVISNKNYINDIVSNKFEQQYNEIFSKLKNFSDFYCNNMNMGIKKEQIQEQEINLQLPNYSLSDNIDKKMIDIFYTIKIIINFIELNFKNNNILNKNGFDNYMNEINDLNIKIKKLSGLFNKNENLLKQITDENNVLKVKNNKLENIIKSINNKNSNVNNNQINPNQNPKNINNNANNLNNLLKKNVGYNPNYSINNDYNSPKSDIKEKKPILDLKDLISLSEAKNDNLMNEFYNKNQQITSLENEVNKLIKENYVGANKNINNHNLNNININNANNNQIFTFENENENEKEEYEDEKDKEEEIIDDIANNITNNNDVNDNSPNEDNNEADNDEYEEVNYYDNNFYNEEGNYVEQEENNDDNDNY